jgi:hypothetical protein
MLLMPLVVKLKKFVKVIRRVTVRKKLVLVELTMASSRPSPVFAAPVIIRLRSKFVNYCG